MRELGENADIDDTFLDEHVLAASQDMIPWFVDFVNYQASDIVHRTCPFIKGKSSCMMCKNSFGMSNTYIGVVLMGYLLLCSIS